MFKSENIVLVALMNNHADFKIALERNWYRIPVKNAPSNIHDSSARIIAFYHTKEFEKEKFTIKWFSEIKRTTIVKREQLFPREPKNPKTGKDYYKIEFAVLRQLPIPIISLRPRRILFIPTTSEKFFSVKEINFLFNSSKLEDKFWNALLYKNIFAERQYFVTVSNKNFFLDFALFCKTRNIDIEIDGDSYHMKEDAVRNDKQRSNLLEIEGWSVLRFTSKEIQSDLSASVNLVIEAANKYGGLQDNRSADLYSYLTNDTGQMKLFS